MVGLKISAKIKSKMEKELEVGILTHKYGENTMIEMPGNVILNIMYFCDYSHLAEFSGCEVFN